MGASTRPDPSPFEFKGGALGCLLLHGFTGSPPEMRPLGEFLHTKGLSVIAPLLPGHGTTPEQLNQVRWQDWYDTAEQALARLKERCQHVFVGGLSMGALLATHLAARHPDIAGLLLYSPALKVANRLLFLTPLAKYVIKQFPAGSDEVDLTDPEASSRLWHYGTFPVGGAAELWALQRIVCAELPGIMVPAIVFYSTRDAMIAPDSARLLYERLGSKDKELVVLHNSGHCMTVDSERQEILARSYGFIAAHTPQFQGTLHDQAR